MFVAVQQVFPSYSNQLGGSSSHPLTRNQANQASGFFVL